MMTASTITLSHSRSNGVVLIRGAMEHLWQYVGTPLITLVLTAIAGLLFKRGVERSTFNKLQESHRTLNEAMNALEKAYNLRGVELSSLTERFGRMQHQFDEQSHRLNDISKLNVELQLEIKARDITIERLNGKIILLEGQVEILQGKLASIRPNS